MTNNGLVLIGEKSVPILGPVHRSPRGDWRTEVMLDGCAHDGKKEEDKVIQHQYGTKYCRKCGAACGVDGLWRRIVPA